MLNIKVVIAYVFFLKTICVFGQSQILSADSNDLFSNLLKRKVPISLSSGISFLSFKTKSLNGFQTKKIGIPMGIDLAFNFISRLNKKISLETGVRWGLLMYDAGVNYPESKYSWSMYQSDPPYGKYDINPPGLADDFHFYIEDPYWGLQIAGNYNVQVSKIFLFNSSIGISLDYFTKHAEYDGYYFKDDGFKYLYEKEQASPYPSVYFETLNKVSSVIKLQKFLLLSNCKIGTEIIFKRGNRVHLTASYMFNPTNSDLFKAEYKVYDRFENFYPALDTVKLADEGVTSTDGNRFALTMTYSMFNRTLKAQNHDYRKLKDKVIHKELSSCQNVKPRISVKAMLVASGERYISSSLAAGMHYWRESFFIGPTVNHFIDFVSVKSALSVFIFQWEHDFTPFNKIYKHIFSADFCLQDLKYSSVHDIEILISFVPFSESYYEYFYKYLDFTFSYAPRIHINRLYIQPAIGVTLSQRYLSIDQYDYTNNTKGQLVYWYKEKAVGMSITAKTACGFIF